MLYKQQISLPTSINLNPHWIVREEVAKINQQQTQDLRVFQQSIEDGTHVDQPQHVLEASTGQIRYYNQNFFNEFENQSNLSSNIMLGPDGAFESASTDNIIDESIRDITNEWNANDPSLNLIKRAVEAESVFLIKLACQVLKDQVGQDFVPQAFGEPKSTLLLFRSIVSMLKSFFLSFALLSLFNM